MSPEKSVKRTPARWASGRNWSAAPEPEMVQRPEPERQYVDVDPWAMLLEQLMVMPEERPVGGESADGPEGERKPSEATAGRRRQGRASVYSRGMLSAQASIPSAFGTVLSPVPAADQRSRRRDTCGLA